LNTRFDTQAARLDRYAALWPEHLRKLEGGDGENH